MVPPGPRWNLNRSARFARAVAYLVTAALMGDAVASVASTVLGRLSPARSSTPARVGAASAAPPVAPDDGPLPQRFRPILERNLFSASPLASARAPAPAAAAPPVSPLAARYELVGTVVDASGPGSRAVLRARGTADDAGRTLGIGAALEDARVLAIDRRHVLVGSGDAVEQLGFDLDAESASPEEATPGAVPSAPAGAAVSRASDGAYEIDGETFRRLSLDPAPLMRDARFVPDTGPAGAGGWRVFAVRPGSLFAQLGLVDGDVVRAIGSTRLAGLDATLTGLASLRDGRAFEVTVERGQLERTLRYRVR